MKGEIWKPVRNYEGLYEVSNMGRVRSLERTAWIGKGCYRTVPERILKARKNRGGYLQVNLYKEGKMKRCSVHQLVAQVFCENLEGYKEINHIDENKLNNRADNLEWCSRSYNMHYGTRTEKISKPIFSVDKKSGLIMWWKSAKEAEDCTGIAHQNISKCCKGKIKSAGGHIWFYADDDNE